MSRNEENSRIAVRTRKTRAHNLRLVRIFVYVIILAIAFWGGFAIRGQSEFLQSLGFSSFVTGIDDSASTTAKKDVYNSLSQRIAEVEDILSTESVDELSDLESVTVASLGGFADAYNDSYLRYYTQARYESLVNSSATGYAGIGVLFSDYDGKAYVVDVFEGSAAQLAGVREGDFVLGIDGDTSTTWTTSEVASSLNRAEGEEVSIVWRRPESLEATGGTVFNTTLTCKTYSVRNVTTELTDNVGYIKVAQITQSSAETVRTAISELTNQGATSFVLDLRDNPGGYLTQAVDIASLFMKSGAVVTIKTKDGESVKSATAIVATEAPVVVLANGNTAGAAEVIVAALKESTVVNAPVVGTTTIGKGSVQATRRLSFGGAIRYTAAYYLTPLGHDIDKVGVTPSITVESTGSEDNQKSYAIELATSLAEA